MPAISIIYTFLYCLFENKYVICHHESRYYYNLRLYAYVMSLCVLLMLLQRVVVLLCCGLSFGIAMPAYNRTWDYVRTYIKQCK